MNKFANALKAFYLILRKPWLLNHILHAEENVQAQVIRTFGFKNGLQFAANMEPPYSFSVRIRAMKN